MIRFAFRLAKHFGELDPYKILNAIDRRLLVEWIAFLQLEPFHDEKADIRETWHTANLMDVLTTEEFTVDETVLESLQPVYWREPEAPAVDQILTDAQKLQMQILAAFKK